MKFILNTDISALGCMPFQYNSIDKEVPKRGLKEIMQEVFQEEAQLKTAMQDLQAGKPVRLSEDQIIYIKK